MLLIDYYIIWWNSYTIHILIKFFYHLYRFTIRGHNTTQGVGWRGPEENFSEDSLPPLSLWALQMELKSSASAPSAWTYEPSLTASDYRLHCSSITRDFCIYIPGFQNLLFKRSASYDLLNGISWPKYKRAAFMSNESTGPELQAS